MAFLILSIGAVLILAGIFIFNKLPGVRLRYVRILMLTGGAVLIAGLLVLFLKPGRGFLAEGSKTDTGNDDVSGVEEGSGGAAEEGTIIIDGNNILTAGGSYASIDAFYAYLISSEWQGGYALIDRYAVYETYEEVKRALKEAGKTVISEEAAE